MQRHAGNPRSIEAFARASFGTDTRAILPTIHVPTLVVHRRDDRAVDVHNGRYLAEQIAGAKYVELPGIDHIPWIDHDAILVEIQEFVTGTRPQVEVDHVLATVFFTDIVGSTARAAELGDERWSDLLSAHHAAIRRELARFRGEEVDTAGDGFLALFDGPWAIGRDKTAAEPAEAGARQVGPTGTGAPSRATGGLTAGSGALTRLGSRP